jgi:hypothetical protein
MREYQKERGVSAVLERGSKQKGNTGGEGLFI